MTGRYLILTPVESVRDEKRFDTAWRKFAEICRSLNRDGLDYSVQFNLTDLKPHVLITASGTAKPRKQPATRAFTLPPPVPQQRCRERAMEAEWFLPEFREKRKDGTAYWHKHQARYQELSQMAEDHIRAEAEYWRELELISGQRQHFKPGMPDDAGYIPEEVAA
jgi:hypothetical protein